MDTTFRWDRFMWDYMKNQYHIRYDMDDRVLFDKIENQIQSFLNLNNDSLSDDEFRNLCYNKADEIIRSLKIH
jgi:hypothetical protein